MFGLCTYLTWNFTRSVWLYLDVSKSTDRMANIVDPDQTAPKQFDLGLHFLLRPTCPNIYHKYFIQVKQEKNC